MNLTRKQAGKKCAELGIGVASGVPRYFNCLKTFHTASPKQSPPPQARKDPSSLPPCPTDQNERYHNCYGVYSASNGNKYLGEWKNGKFHGQGTYTFFNGNKYVGEWRNGKYNGQGVLHNNVYGKKYVGEFKDYDKHGQGIETYEDGRVYEGIWEYDWLKYAQKISPTQKQPEQSPSNLTLDKAEKKCAEIGFTKGTEKYGDCVMKLLN